MSKEDMEENNKVTFNKLSTPLKTLVVMGWIYLSYILIVFLAYFMIGFIEGITGTVLLT